MGLLDLVETECARFRCVRRGAIVRIVRDSCALRARFMAASLSLALIYAFACSGACALCTGASAASATETLGCGHATSDAGSGSQQRGPAKPDCFGHHRFDFDVVQSDGLSLVQLSATGYATQLFQGAVRVEGVDVGASFYSDLAPPRLVANFPQQDSSILRI
jgi:hypothetical protein